MKLRGIDNLNNTYLDKLYKFLIKSDNITNKFNINNLILSIIYLRKIFNKSIKSKKSLLEKVKYNYVITDNDEIICYFSLHYIKKENNVSINDLTLLISNKEPQTNIISIINIILDEYHKLSSNMFGINILALYLPNNLNDITDCVHNISKFEFAFIDNTTYQQEFNIYYNLYINDNLVSKKQHEKQSEYTKGQIIELLMNQYGVNTIINPMREISKKLTRKSIAIPEIKVITKNIFDIKEIQDLPEYDYDFIKVYSVNYFSLLEYFINKKQKLDNNEIKNFIKDRFFPGSLLINDNIIQLYSKIIEFIVTNYSNCNIKSNIININFIFKNKVNNKVSYFIKNKLLYSLLNKNNATKLIISNNFTTIGYFNNFAIDIISLKQTANNINLISEINNKFKSNKIHHAINYYELNSVLKSINKKVNSIAIDINYANYDNLIGNINIIIKTQFIINTIFNAIKYIKNNGNLIILLEKGYLSTPIFKKIISILLELFKLYEIITLPTPTINIIIFKNLININYYQQNIIEQIINKTNQYEDKELKLDDIYDLIISNKFTYKIDNNENNNKIDNKIDNKINNKINNNTKYNILFDIENLNIKNQQKVNNFFNDYYLIQNKILNNNKILLKNNDLCDYLNKYVEQRYLSIFKFIDKYKLFE